MNLTKDILLTLTYLVGAGELALAIFFWVTRSGNEIRKVMALLSFSTGMWVETSAILAYKPESNFTLFLSSLVFVFGAGLVFLLVHFVLVYPYRLIQLDRWHIILFYIPLLLLSVSAFIPGLISKGLSGGQNNPGTVHPGPMYNLYNVYLLILFISQVALLAYRRKRLDGMHKSNATVFLWAVILGGIPAVFLDLVLPLINPNFQPNSLYGNLFTVIWLGMITYIVTKK